ncbi:geranylgeranyl reductase family protein [Ilumatobacter sp.]|uniref:geranylgeranyl reductase family protein n=1 Tax=Ilumatobacter sp. TaxID=1967498 RepID=UPI003AF4F491
MTTNSTSTCDVLVVGAGPAGIAAAITLHRAGRSVVVIDKARFPRDKCCGDGLTTLALRELEALGLVPDDVDDWHDVDAAVLRSPSGREITVPLPDRGRYAAIAPRISLDHALVELARRIGVDVRDGHGFSALDAADADHVDVDVDGYGTVRCRYVVAADGMWSAVRKAVGAGIDGYRGEWHAFRQYARNVTGRASDSLIVWFERDLLPGYAWSFPLPGNRVNVGFGVLREDDRRVSDMAALWRDLLTRPHVVEALGPDAEFEGRHTAWPIPARVDDVTLTSGRTLFVGDAAAATDVMTGEGIGQALLTGRLAAEAVVAGGALAPEATASHYERAVAAELFADHRMSKRLGAVLKHPVGARGAIRVVGASGDWGRRNFARWMFEDEPRAIATSPRRWHRDMLARAGAYADG